MKKTGPGTDGHEQDKSMNWLVDEFQKGTISRRKFLIVSGMLGGAALLGGTGLFAPGLAFSSKEPIRIGVLFPLSGNLALLGDESRRGCVVAMEQMNAKGGINGRPIEFITADVTDPKAGVVEAERLISNKGIKIMLGTYASAISYAVTAVANRHKVVYMETTAVADNIMTRGFPYLFRNTCTTTIFGRDAVAHSLTLASKMNIQKDKLRLAFVNEDSLYGTSVTDSGLKVATEQGIKVVAQEAYNAKMALDLSPVILRLRDANPDIVIHTAYMTDAILFQRQSKDLNCYAKAMMGVSAGYGITGFVKALGKMSDGILCTDYTQWRTNANFAAKLPDFDAAYQQKYGEKPRSGQSIASFDAANSLFMGLAGAKSLAPEDIRKSLLTIDIPKYQTATGWGVKFDPQTGQNERNELICFQWKGDEQWTVLPDKARLSGVTMDLPLKPWSERG